MPVEHCAECGFDGRDWTDEEAIYAVSKLGTRWAEAVAGLVPSELQRRPIPGTWSIAEYANHVREVLFAMRFVLDSAENEPGVDLVVPPESEFSFEPLMVDVPIAVSGIEQEAAEYVGTQYMTPITISAM
ncbi:MAG: DinB family protein [Acidimicrobiales bacterium]